MSFTLSGGAPTVEVSASAWVSSQNDTTATITVQSNSWMVYSGSWVYSSGVVADVYSGYHGSWLGRKTIFGNGSEASGTGVRSVTHSFTVSKGTKEQDIYWQSDFHSYIDGTDLGCKATKSGYVRVGAKTHYTVSYNANGGTNAPAAQTKWHDTPLTLDENWPTRTGYIFQGWATSPTGGVVAYAGGNYTTNSSVTFYAVWLANTYTISYDANNGTGAPDSQIKTYGVDLTLSTSVPTRTNYNFLGWSTSPTAVTPEYAAGATFTVNEFTTLYAVWELAYIPPTIVGLTAHRCASNGSSDDYGTSALVTFNWETCQLVGENKVASIDISIDGGAPTTLTPGGISGRENVVVGSEALSIESRYTITVTVTDSMDGFTTRSVLLPGASFPLDFKAGGTGAAFGKPAELDALDVNWDAIFRKGIIIGDPEGEHTEISADGSGTVVDWVEDFGQEGIWTWVKYASGIAECWGKVGKTIDLTYAQDDNYYGYVYTQKYPFEFLEPPVVSIETSDANGNVWTARRTDGTTSETPQVYPVACGSASSLYVEIVYTAKGLWKELERPSGGMLPGGSGGGGGGDTSYATADISDFVPGKVFAYAGVDDPIGSLPCDGREVSRREYWELFQAVGTTYGAGDGSTTFNLPNLESRTIIGESDSYSLGETGGEEKHTLTVDEMPSHDHDFYYNTVGVPQGSYNLVMYASAATHEATSATGGDQPHNNMQPYIVMRYFITTGKGEAVNGVNPADYVVEWGQTDGWNWRKYASGWAECWREIQVSCAATNQYGGLYYQSKGPYSFPFAFKSAPNMQANVFMGNGLWNVSVHTLSESDFYFYAQSATSMTGTPTFLFNASGFWKDAPESGGIQISDVSDYIAGRIFAYAGADDPTGCLLCDGRAVSRKQYWELFNAIGITYGAGDGSTTFNLPNIESRTIIGESDGYALGSTGGEEKHTLTVDEMPSHAHSLTFLNGQSLSYAYPAASSNTGGELRSDASVANTGGSQPHNNMQPYIVMRYFITTGKTGAAYGVSPADYIVEWKDDDNGWHWEKWASGKAECWAVFYEEGNTPYVEWNNMPFRYTPTWSFPFEFTDVPSISYSGYVGSGFAIDARAEATNSWVRLFYATSATGSQKVEAHVQAKGYWKDAPATGGVAFGHFEDVTVTKKLTIDGFEPILKQTRDGYPGMIAANNDADTFIRTPQQGLIPYTPGGSSQVGTVGWPFNEVHSKKLFANGRDLCENKILAAPGYYMTDAQTVTLSEPISAQPHGVVLAWSAIYDGIIYDYDWIYTFIPKRHVAAYSGTGIQCQLSHAASYWVGGKYLYVSDTSITGHKGNTYASNSSPINFNNAYWVLRHVIGV